MFPTDELKFKRAVYVEAADILIQSSFIDNCAFQSNWDVRLNDNSSTIANLYNDTVFNNGIKCLKDKVKTRKEYYTTKKKILDSYYIQFNTVKITSSNPINILFFDEMTINDAFVISIEDTDQLDLFDKYSSAVAKTKFFLVGLSDTTVDINFDPNYNTEGMVYFTLGGSPKLDQIDFAAYDDKFNTREIIDRTVTKLNLVVYFLDKDRTTMGNILVSVLI